MFIMILFLSCSRSFMNRRSRCFCLTCSISERRFAMVFRLCSCCSLRPLALSALVWEILLVKSRTFSFTLVFLDILHILHWSRQIFSLFAFKPTCLKCLHHSVLYRLLYRWFDRYIFQVLIFLSVWSGWSACVLAELPRPDLSFYL